MLTQGSPFQRRGSQVLNGAPCVLQVGLGQAKRAAHGQPGLSGATPASSNASADSSCSAIAVNPWARVSCNSRARPIALLQRARWALRANSGPARPQCRTDRPRYRATADPLVRARASQCWRHSARRAASYEHRSNAGMVAQAVGAVNQVFEPAARNHVDVGCAIQIARSKGIKTVAGSLHVLRTVRKRWRQVENSRQIWARRCPLVAARPSRLASSAAVRPGPGPPAGGVVETNWAFSSLAIALVWKLAIALTQPITIANLGELSYCSLLTAPCSPDCAKLACACLRNWLTSSSGRPATSQKTAKGSSWSTCQSQAGRSQKPGRTAEA